MLFANNPHARVSGVFVCVWGGGGMKTAAEEWRGGVGNRGNVEGGGGGGT